MDKSKIKTVLTIDPGISSGYAVANIKDGIFTIFDYGIIDISKEFEFQGDECIDLMSQIGEIIEKHGVDYVAIEDYFFSGRFAQGSTTNVAYRTAIHILCRKMGIEYTILNISSWKKFISGRTTPTPLQKKKWGKESAKKIMTQESLWVNYGIRFPNHSLSNKTGKPIKFRYDVVDAVAQAIYFARLYLDVNGVQIEVDIPPDVEFKKPPKTYFNYEG